MTFQQAIAAAKLMGGAYIKMLGVGKYERWTVLGKDCSGNFNGVSFIDKRGRIESCR